MIQFLDIVLKICICVFAVILTSVLVAVVFVAIREVIRDGRQR